MMFPATQEFKQGVDYTSQQAPQEIPRSKILEKYSKDIENIQATDFALGNVNKALEAFKKYNGEDDSSEEDDSILGAISNSAARIGQKIKNITNTNSPEYINYRNAIESDLIYAKLRNEGIPVTDATLKHYKEMFDPATLSTKQVEQILKTEYERNNKRNALIGLETNIENPAMIGTNEDFQKSASDIATQLQNIKTLASAPTHLKTNRFPDTQELVDENSEIVKNDIDSLYSSNPEASEKDVFKTITGVDPEDATQGDIHDFLVTYGEASNGKDWSPTLNKIFGGAIGALIGISPSKFTWAAMSVFPAIYQGGKETINKVSEGEPLYKALESGKEKGIKTLKQELEAALVGFAGGFTARTLTKRPILNASERIVSSLFGSNKSKIPFNSRNVTAEKVAGYGGGSSNIKNVEDRISEESNALAQQTYGKLKKEDIVSKLNDNNPVDKEMMRIYDIKTSGAVAKDPAMSLHEVIKEMSSSDYVEQLSQKTSLPIGSVRSRIEEVENTVFPTMGKLTMQKKAITKLQKASGSSASINQIIKSLDEAGGWTKQDWIDMAPNILEAVASRDILEKALKENSSGGIGQLADLASKIITSTTKVFTKRTGAEIKASEEEKKMRDALSKIEKIIKERY